MSNSEAEKALKTIDGKEIPLSTRGILYLCVFTNGPLNLEVVNSECFDSSFDALNCYSNIPNPESQLVMGKTYNELITKLHKLHENIKNEDWLKDLSSAL